MSTLDLLGNQLVIGDYYCYSSQSYVIPVSVVGRYNGKHNKNGKPQLVDCYKLVCYDANNKFDRPNKFESQSNTFVESRQLVPITGQQYATFIAQESQL